jgi:hypothetical protein
VKFLRRVEEVKKMGCGGGERLRWVKEMREFWGNGRC